VAVRGGVDGRRLAAVERDAQPDLDVPAGDLDIFDEQPQEVLALGGVELTPRARTVGPLRAQFFKAEGSDDIGCVEVAFQRQGRRP